MLLSSSLKRRWLPVTTARDKWVMNVIAPFIWVMIAYTVYLAFASGRIGEGIAQSGLLIVLFSTLVGPHLWGVVEHADAALNKVLAILIAFGILTMATGWLIRLMT